MNILEQVMKKSYALLGKPYIPKELTRAKGPLLLHISDTPEEIFSYLYRVIDLINPQYIVHTGDIVDNIKLESFRHHLYLYKQGSEKLIMSIEGRENLKAYYALGNHDDFETIKAISSAEIILKEGIISIEGIIFYLCHYHRKIASKIDYHLFGHSFEPRHYVTKKHVGLNGLLHMNVIDLSTRKVYQIEYPLGTNVFRKMEKRRIGI